MNIYISGISGTGMGPLALMAKKAGLGVFGSDQQEGAVAGELFAAEIPVFIGGQDGKFLTERCEQEGVDWFVHTSALRPDAPELLKAKELGLRISKRDELIAYLVEILGLKMVAVAGTHGKTTTTALITFAALELGLPVSYLVGSTLPFAEAGAYREGSKFLIYEADEYDRNFLKFYPWLSVITTVTFDHPDIYTDEADYRAAFRRFEGQSERVINGAEIAERLAELGVSEEAFTLAGEARRMDEKLAFLAILAMAEEAEMTVSADEVIAVLNRFPGVGRRFERISPGIYSDYAHHPEEVAATMEIALEEAKRQGLSGVVAVYEPHQNTRQHEVLNAYRKAFSGAERIFWLPTYLTRENPELKVLQPVEFIARLANSSVAEPAELNEKLYQALLALRAEGKLVLLMSAGPADGWLRQQKWK